MASLYKKVISGKPYWYLREMGWADGKPKLVSERYLGSAADIEALLDAREAAVMPERTRHLAFGDVAAAWGVLDDLGVAAIIDEVAGARRGDAGASAGTYLVLAALNRLVAPCSKLGFADWWKTTAADRFTKIPASVLDHRRFWTAMRAVTMEQLAEISRRIAVRIVEVSGVDCSSVALDMTVVFDAGQNSEANFAHLAATGLSWIGSVPASDCPDLTALPASARSIVDEDRFAGLTAYDTRRQAYGTSRRAILTHSPELHEAQARGFDGTTLAKAARKLDELAATLARGKTRRPREKVAAEIEAITKKPWVRQVVTWQLDGSQPRDLRLTWSVNPEARAALEEDIFGKHVLITSHDDWPVPEVVAGYRSQSEAEFSFRQMKDTHVVSFSPMHHWTQHNIRVHVFTCVLALQIAHLMRRKAAQAGPPMSVRQLLGRLAGIGETVLIYPSAGGRPKARRMITELSEDQRRLYQIFGLDRWAPRS